MSRWSGAVKTADSLDVVEHEKSLEYQEKLKRQAELKEQAYLDSITKATNEISAADAQAAAAMHNEINLKLHEVTGPLKFEEAKAALLTYDQIPNVRCTYYQILVFLLIQFALNSFEKLMFHEELV